MLKNLVKSAFSAVGLKVEKRDPLEEAMPAMCRLQSVYLPRVNNHNVWKLLYLREIIERTRGVPGDVVECGTSIGYGLLMMVLLGEELKIPRTYYGFDSFEGFPAPTSEDGATHASAGYLANPPELVLKVLADGGVKPEVIADRVKLVRGFFDKTLSSYQGKIAVLNLDCDLYRSYRDCLEVLYDRVMSGGVLMFDDYRDKKFPGAQQAVDEFLSDKPEKVTLLPGFHWGWHAVKQ